MSQLIITERTLDVEKSFKEKSPKLGKFLPGFVFSYLRKIVHEKELNKLLYDNKEELGFDFIDAALENAGTVLGIKGLENISEEGRFIVSANHPLGGLDGIALMKAVGTKRKDIIFPVNDLLMAVPNFDNLFIPINKHGSNAENIKIINDTFDSEKIMLYFPAGLVSRKQDNGEIRDLEWKTTFISRSIKHKRDIIPTYVDGNNSKFFYNLSFWRKKLGIKANLEMLFLVNEMYKQKGKPINIVFGKPIPYQTFDKRFNRKGWANKVKDYVYLLSQEGKDGISFENYLLEK
jgi:putative hemolysin